MIPLKARHIGTVSQEDKNGQHTYICDLLTDVNELSDDLLGLLLGAIAFAALFVVDGGFLFGEELLNWLGVFEFNRADLQNC